MGTATIEVPERYAEDFRDAVLAEIAWDANHVKDAIADEQRIILTARGEAGGKAEGCRAPDSEDIDGAVGSLHRSHRLLAQAWRGDQRIEGETEVLAHVLETLTDKILAPRLADKVNVTPIQEKEAAEITGVTDQIGWAVREAARLDSIWQAQHADEKAEVA